MGNIFGCHKKSQCSEVRISTVNSQPNIRVQTTRVQVPTEDQNYTTDQSKFQQECLKEHNRLRTLHGSPPLQLNRSLCKFAKEWADNLARRSTMEHRSQEKYGENIYMSYGIPINGATSVKSWYDEIKDYNFNSGGFSMDTGHFTQVVWKGCKELGVGFKTNSKGTTYVVANYDPPGNYQGQYKENVLPPK